MAFQIDHETMDGPDKDTDASQAGHVGFNMNRVDALAAGVDLEQLGKLVCDQIEELDIDAQSSGIRTYAPKRLLADVFGLIAHFTDIQGLVPLDVESQLFDHLFVG
jgi:hypothetical protein